MVNLTPDQGKVPSSVDHQDGPEKPFDSIPWGVMHSLQAQVRNELRNVGELERAHQLLSALSEKKAPLSDVDMKELAKVARSTLTLTNRLTDLDPGIKKDVQKSLLNVIELAEGKPAVGNVSNGNVPSDPNAAISELTKQIKAACDEIVGKHQRPGGRLVA